MTLLLHFVENWCMSFRTHVAMPVCLVEVRIRELRDMGEQMIQKLEATFNMELCRIPKVWVTSKWN